MAKWLQRPGGGGTLCTRLQGVRVVAFEWSRGEHRDGNRVNTYSVNVVGLGDFRLMGRKGIRYRSRATKQFVEIVICQKVSASFQLTRLVDAAR